MLATVGVESKGLSLFYNEWKILVRLSVGLDAEKWSYTERAVCLSQVRQPGVC